ncbi:Pentatricopeptide repeat-containing protein [Thalictrum thalictroides]|uniref:Pentatricopeptide repeat-containing protein n=1 Tax=Thalictrum thalictroides TaxID=46969 RepID=A0A7J6UXT5_THATH|nr:Pentatricopeptide repeat-containing protein [Thalictrum thalictroides]
MESQSLVPDVLTYILLLYGFCQHGKMQDAEHIFRKMTQRDVKPDKSTYTSLMDGYVAQDNLKEAFRYHDEMLQIGFVPDDNF